LDLAAPLVVAAVIRLSAEIDIGTAEEVDC
jgi:hypothetical protein